jgi:hypothetical protein
MSSLLAAANFISTPGFETDEVGLRRLLQSAGVFGDDSFSVGS